MSSARIGASFSPVRLEKVYGEWDLQLVYFCLVIYTFTLKILVSALNELNLLVF